MAGFQKLLVSLLVFLGVTFVYFAQTAEAAKGPKITHKVRIGGFKLAMLPSSCTDHSCRSFSTSSMAKRI